MKKVIILMAAAVLLISIAGGDAQPGANKKGLKEVRQQHEVKLFEIEGVSGVSADEEANEIIVYLERPEVKNRVPKTLDGFPVKFVVTGRIEALRAPALIQTVIYSRTGINRPVFGGISVGNPKITAGTLGIITDNGYVLSNAHVLALDSKAKFLPKDTTQIWQPGKYDGGTSENTIGYLKNYTLITFNDNSANNRADAAIANLTVAENISYVLNETGDGFYTINGNTTVAKNDTVRKSGRTTGVTTNNVTDTNASVKVCYVGFILCTKWAVFKEQIIINNPNQAFVQGGDSGSAVDKDGEFVGLVFAGSITTAVVNKQENILGPLGITI